MATTLDNIKQVAQGDYDIQDLHDSDPAVVQVLADVERIVPERLGDHREMAQRYLAAHFLSVAFAASGGQGPLSTESIGGISQSFTLPYLNQKTVIASTQYGLQYLELMRMFTVPAIVAKV